jgi:hypothetical protein
VVVLFRIIPGIPGPVPGHGYGTLKIFRSGIVYAQFDYKSGQGLSANGKNRLTTGLSFVTVPPW